MSYLKKSIFAIIAISIFASSCDDDVKKPNDPNPEEVITTMKLQFTEEGTNNKFEAIFRDPDGDGGNAPTRFDSISLQTGKSYLVNILLLDESNIKDVDTISNEVKKEANDHIFFIEADGVDVAISILDKDTNVPALPLGLESRWVAGAVSGTATSHVHVTLKHQPGEKNGTETPGDTDIDLEFLTKVK